MLKLAVFISGRGSNLDSIIKFQKETSSHFTISLVISDQPNAKGVNIAKKAGIPVSIFEISHYTNRNCFDRAIHLMLERSNIDLIALAGYMRLLSEEFVEKWEGRLINIHPSLLPAFPGLAPQKQALQAGVKTSGCTIFWVDEGMDTGAIIAQDTVPVEKDDTEQTLSQRILKREHLLYPRIIEKIAIKKITFSDR